MLFDKDCDENVRHDLVLMLIIKKMVAILVDLAKSSVLNGRGHADDDSS